MKNFIPINDCVLVELLEEYEFVATPDKQYATKTSGYVRAISSDEEKYTLLMNKKVWFESYKDDIKIDSDGKSLTFIKYDDIRGYDVEA